MGQSLVVTAVCVRLVPPSASQTTEQRKIASGYLGSETPESVRRVWPDPRAVPSGLPQGSWPREVQGEQLPACPELKPTGSVHGQSKMKDAASPRASLARAAVLGSAGRSSTWALPSPSGCFSLRLHQG